MFEIGKFGTKSEYFKNFLRSLPQSIPFEQSSDFFPMIYKKIADCQNNKVQKKCFPIFQALISFPMEFWNYHLIKKWIIFISVPSKQPTKPGKPYDWYGVNEGKFISDAYFVRIRSRGIFPPLSDFFPIFPEIQITWTSISGKFCNL